jgi:hypothetical protein
MSMAIKYGMQKKKKKMAHGGECMADGGEVSDEQKRVAQGTRDAFKYKKPSPAPEPTPQEKPKPKAFPTSLKRLTQKAEKLAKAHVKHVTALALIPAPKSLALKSMRQKAKVLRETT